MPGDHAPLFNLVDPVGQVHGNIAKGVVGINVDKIKASLGKILHCFNRGFPNQRAVGVGGRPLPCVLIDIFDSSGVLAGDTDDFAVDIIFRILPRINAVDGEPRLAIVDDIASPGYPDLDTNLKVKFDKKLRQLVPGTVRNPEGITLFLYGVSEFHNSYQCLKNTKLKASSVFSLGPGVLLPSTYQLVKS